MQTLNKCLLIFSLAIGKNFSPGIYNIGSGFSTSVKKILEIVQNQTIGTNKLNLEKSNTQKNTTNNIENYWCDNSKLIKNFEKIIYQ